MYGIFFDLDGTLADSDPIHFQAWQTVLANINPNKDLIDRKFFDENISGRFNIDITRTLLPDLTEKERFEIGERKDRLFLQIAKENLRSIKGLDKIIEFINENRSKFKIGLATNATRMIADFELELLNIDRNTFFDAILTIDEFGIGKPKPDMYLELVRRLNLDKNSCIIFEDSISGVRAAVAAQIKCIGILTTVKKDILEQYGTWRTAENFQHIDLNDIFNSIKYVY